MILTAQRRDEVAGLERAELDLDKCVWAMPREKAKNNRAHAVQLSTAAMDVLNSVPPIGNRFVFTFTGAARVSGSRAPSGAWIPQCWQQGATISALTVSRFRIGPCTICGARP